VVRRGWGWEWLIAGFAGTSLGAGASTIQGRIYGGTGAQIHSGEKTGYATARFPSPSSYMVSD